MPKTKTATAAAFEAAAAAATAKPKRTRKPKAPPPSTPRAGSRTVAMMREREEREGRDYARELADSLERELEAAMPETERSRRSLRALADESADDRG
jgi:hypothetical protein